MHDILGCSVKQSFASFFVDTINSCKTTYSKLCFELHLAKMDKMSCTRMGRDISTIIWLKPGVTVRAVHRLESRSYIKLCYCNDRLPTSQPQKYCVRHTRVLGLMFAIDIKCHTALRNFSDNRYVPILWKARLPITYRYFTPHRISQKFHCILVFNVPSGQDAYSKQNQKAGKSRMGRDIASVVK